ncbi:SMP-30/gluconolactonase/LRE family protein [Vallicoccus soli]|uniref:SMP-30/gluconolactonase/LRE family protein n=1 Tax=Vallicoccus soli TaxID=2339232 RepID=A0A3A3Z362_9ACTN|nr:SMP-30/gluconolactonase/LRE family protein [Vallicoccus soli]RJK94901.1 SMP-30/gluconolactonase/LRE family protein [Vallicoccus soli]
MTRLEQLTPVVTFHGEGPVWDPAAERLLCVDMLAGAVLSVDADGAVARHAVGDVAACVRPRAGGGYVVAVERGFALLDALDDPDPDLLPPLWSDPGVRMNEGGCDPQGRFWCGSMAYDAAEGAGTLWRLDPDGTVLAALSGVTISNGLAWRPDGTALYVDTPTQRIDVLAFDEAGLVASRTPFVEVPEDAGSPDGLVLDAEGGAWVALHGGGAVHRYDADGRLSEVLEVPTPQPTAVTFGGPDLRDLYVTTSRQGLGDEDRVAGSLHVARPGVAGVPVLPFAG